jgi:mono/diheme cytochrome c family protein
MQSSWLRVVLAVAAMFSSVTFASDTLVLRETSTSPQDLKVSGDLPGLPAGSTRFIAYDELSRLPQVDFRVLDDPNFHGPAEISGVYLDELLRMLGIPEKGLMVAAVCDDHYEAHYSEDYLHAHRPILVLRLDGKPLMRYKRTRDDGVFGPYLVSHASFQPRYHILAHAEEAQIPNGVVELRFLKQDAVLDAIRPRGVFAEDSPEMEGYRIAQQNCFRCHNQGAEGGQMAGITFSMIGMLAKSSPDFFAKYVRTPQAVNPKSNMAGSPQYDDATIAALRAYFTTFTTAEQK